MQIAELMKMIPDDGEINFKNNSGLVVIEVRMYNFYISEMIELNKCDDDWLKKRIPIYLDALNNKQKINANS